MSRKFGCMRTMKGNDVMRVHIIKYVHPVQILPDPIGLRLEMNKNPIRALMMIFSIFQYI